jgi:hypothetical protein
MDEDLKLALMQKLIDTNGLSCNFKIDKYSLYLEIENLVNREDEEYDVLVFSLKEDGFVKVNQKSTLHIRDKITGCVDWYSLNYKDGEVLNNKTSNYNHGLAGLSVHQEQDVTEEFFDFYKALLDKQELESELPVNENKPKKKDKL